MFQPLSLTLSAYLSFLMLSHIHRLSVHTTCYCTSCLSFTLFLLLFVFWFPLVLQSVAHHFLTTVIVTAVFSQSDVSDKFAGQYVPSACMCVFCVYLCWGQYRAVPWWCLPTSRLSTCERHRGRSKHWKPLCINVFSPSVHPSVSLLFLLSLRCLFPYCWLTSSSIQSYYLKMRNKHPCCISPLSI